MLRGRSLYSHALFALFALVTLAACSSSRRPLACAEDSDCPEGVKCALGSCIAGELPRAQIVLRSGTALVTHRPISFDGSNSDDPNPEGGLVAFDWNVERASGTHCDPTPARGSESVLSTIFTCEGDYQVDLVVQNTLGLQSQPASLAVAIAASTNPPAITRIGPDLTLGHHCAGTPLLCAAAAPDGQEGFQLGAEASDVESGTALTYAWEYEPPQGVDRSSVTVRFEPGPGSSSPLVHVESPGKRIAGEWTFTVKVTDGDGLVTPAQQKVTIANKPPAVTPAENPVRVEHLFQAGMYLAARTLAAQIQDPDGDPVVSELRLVEETPTGCAFHVSHSALEGGQLSTAFELTAVPGQEPQFIGPARHLDLVGRDVNGGETVVSLPLEILNRPPVFQWRQGVAGADTRLLTVKHGVTSCDQAPVCFLAQKVSPLEARDPDGDPLGAVSLSAIGIDASSKFTSSDGQHFAVTTDVLSPEKFRSKVDGLSPFAVRARVADPWSSSPDDSSAQFRLNVSNTPPHAGPVPDAVSYWYSDDDRAYHAQADFSAIADDEGDPLHVAGQSAESGGCVVSLQGTGVARMTCKFSHDWRNGAPVDMSAFFAAHSVSLTPADSWVEGQAASKAITIPDAAPTNAGGKLYVHPHCTCSGKYPVLPTRVTLGLPISDAQNTPLYIDVASISCGTLLSPATFGTLQGVNLSLDIAGCSGHVQLGVTANDGHPRQPPSQPASYDVTFYCNEDDCGAPAPGAGQ